MHQKFLCTLLMFLSLSCQEKRVDFNWELGPFTKLDANNPVLIPRDSSAFICPIRATAVRWEQKDVFNPAAIVKDGVVYLLYRAEDTIGQYAGTSRIGLAGSKDGIHFTKEKEPVLHPDNDPYKSYEWEGGCEDPRIVEDENGVYYMNYTAYDGNLARLFVASSTNLIEWQKHGSVFKNHQDGRLVNIWTKSGAVLTELVDEKLIAKKLNGKYWMYFGDSNMYLAHSENLIDWHPVYEDDPNKQTFNTLKNHDAFKIIFGPRKNIFDSYLVEAGPPPIWTEEGIILIYNSRNGGPNRDPDIPEGTYSAGQVFLDADDPGMIISRSDTTFFMPDKDYEITGQVNNVCFLQGMVLHRGNWFLYYGTADSKIAVATCIF